VALGIYIILIQFDWGKKVFYPFMIFATWCHEMGHALAVLLVGGRVKYIELYSNGSGWCGWKNISAENETVDNLKKAFVYSAGYSMTAWVGFFLLLFRRTRKGPKYGCIGIGIVILLSCAIWVRTKFGLLMMIPFGIILILLGIILQGKGFKAILGIIFTFLAVMCCEVAMWDAHDMFMDSPQFDGSEEDESTDAMKVAEKLGGTHLLWTLVWYIQAVILTIIGLVFSFSPKEKEFDTSGAPGQYNAYVENDSAPIATAYPVNNNSTAAGAYPHSGLVMTDLERGYKAETFR